MLISQIPALTIHIPFLIWELIFGNPGVSRSTPHIKCQLQIPTLRTHIWLTRCWQIYPHIKHGNFTDCLLWQLIFHSYSENSYMADQILADLALLWTAISQIPILTAHISFFSKNSYLADQVLADLPPIKWLISQIAALTAHISFLLSELIFGTPGVGRSSPHQMAI